MKHARVWKWSLIFQNEANYQAEIPDKVFCKTKQINYWESSPVRKKSTGKFFTDSLKCLDGTKPTKAKEWRQWRTTHHVLESDIGPLESPDNVVKM